MKGMWTSVENGLPVTGKDVLVRTENNVYFAGRLDTGMEWWANGWGIITSKVTHWMYIEGPEE